MLGLFLIGLHAFAEMNLSDWLAQEKIPLRAQDYRIFSKRKIADGELIEAKNKSLVLKVQVVNQLDKKKAREFARMQSTVLESAYTSVPSPYMAPITKSIHCDPHLRPRVWERFYLAPVNSRLAYGACHPSMVKYWMAMGFYYEEARQRLYKIQLFSPKTSDFEEVLKSEMDRLIDESELKRIEG